MTLNELADKLDSALKRFNLNDDYGINRRTINNKDHWKDFRNKKESPHINYFDIFIYTIDDESFEMEIHSDGDITFYHRRLADTITDLFIREIFNIKLFSYICKENW